MNSLLKKYLYIILIISIFPGCEKRNFFPDEDDPGLSRLTSYKFNIATVYINSVPYINPFDGPVLGNEIPYINKISSGSITDTLVFTWRIMANDYNLNYNSHYSQIFLLVSIPSTFSKNDFLTFSDQQSFSDRIEISNGNSSLPTDMKGNAAVYFIKSSIDSSGNGSKYYSFTGLFNGNIGDSIIITKGRFDFSIPETNINF